MTKQTRPKDYPKLRNYKPSQFMLPTSHYDKAKADRAVTFISLPHKRKMGWNSILAIALAGAADQGYLRDCKT